MIPPTTERRFRILEKQVARLEEQISYLLKLAGKTVPQGESGFFGPDARLKSDRLAGKRVGNRHGRAKMNKVFPSPLAGVDGF